MSHDAVPMLLHHVRRLAAAAAPDDQILADYVARHDEAAFAALVGRHGPMVLNLCRRVLHDAHAAEDVFQATFLVLAERAAAIRRRTSLASWLHGVAYRLAVRAQRQRARRARPAGDLTACAGPAAATAEGLAWQEMLAILDEELGRLAERYRAPLVLCYLEGRTQDEAARLLNWSLGTLRRRLEQGRALLQARLRARGVTLSAALGGLLAAGVTSVPAPLRAAAVAAARDIAGRCLSAASAVVVAAKPGGVFMVSASVKKLVLLTVCGVALGLGLWAYRSANPAGSGQATAPQAKPPAPAPAAGAAAPDPAFRLGREAVAAFGADPPFQVLLSLAVQEAKRGHVAEAHKRFQQAVDRLAAFDDHQRTGALVLVAYRLADAGDRVAAETMLSKARELAPKITDANNRNDMLRFAAVCLAEKIDPTRAIAHIQENADASCRLSGLRDTAVAQAKAGDMAGARRTVGLMRWPHEYVKLEPWKAIAAAQLKAGDRKAAEATLHEALAAVQQWGMQPKIGNWLIATQVDVLVAYAVAQGRAGDRAGARRTLARVEKLLEPGARAEPLYQLTLLAEGQVKVGEREAAQRTVKRILRAKKEVYGEDDPRVPLKVQLALGDYDGAAKSARGDNHTVLLETCLALAQAGRQETAITLARGEKSAETRTLGLLVVADVALSRVPPERLPRYAGTFTLKIPAKSPAPQPKGAEPEPTPQEQMQAAIKKWEQAWTKFNKRFDQAKTKEERTRLESERPRGDKCANELLALARAHAKERVAFDALAWIVESAGDTPAAAQALTLLRQDHLSASQIGDACEMSLYTRHRKAAHELVQAVLEKSPHRADRGQACLALARFLHDSAQRARYVQRQATPEDIKHYEQWFGAAELRHLQTADPAALEKEAERLYERVLAEFAKLFPGRRGEPLGQSARAALDEIRLLAVGKTAPEIAAEDLDGKPLRLSAHRGKVVVLTFWATWCSSCLARVPHERELVKRLAGRPFVLLGVNGDGDRDKLRAWLDRNPLPWRSWRDGHKGDGQGRIAHAWNVSAWPTVYVLDTRGVIRYRDVSGKALDEAVDALLKEAGR
jgi:RNA polymerase sigma factor (sigma-70 family)